MATLKNSAPATIRDIHHVGEGSAETTIQTANRKVKLTDSAPYSDDRKSTRVVELIQGTMLKVDTSTPSRCHRLQVHVGRRTEGVGDRFTRPGVDNPKELVILYPEFNWLQRMKEK
jgi:hypothetical protein